MSKEKVGKADKSGMDSFAVLWDQVRELERQVANLERDAGTHDAVTRSQVEAVAAVLALPMLADSDKRRKLAVAWGDDPGPDKFEARIENDPRG